MAKISQGILGPYSGKCGNVVGSSWKGIGIQKGYQPIVSNPRTAAQIGNRSLMSNVVAFAQAILATVIKPCWDRFASRMSGYNAFVSANKSLFADELPNPPSSLRTSIGKMAATPIKLITASVGGNTMKIDWDNDAGQGFKLASDLCYIVVWDEVSAVVSGFAPGAVRNAGTVTVTLPSAIPPDNAYNVYLSFLRADGSVVSNNSYLQKEPA